MNAPMDSRLLSGALPSLEMLDDINLLADGDNEMHYYSFPIDDNLFGQYVGQLEAEAKDEAADAFVMPPMSAFPTQPMSQPMNMPAGFPPLEHLGEGMLLNLNNHSSGEAGTPMTYGRIVTSGFQAGFAANEPEAPPHFDRPSGNSTGSGVWGERHSSGDVGDLPDAEEDAAATNEPGGRQASRAKRNAKQQQQNKAAQQRYRERRKQKFHEMEAALNAVQEQMEALGDVKTENTALQGKAAELEQRLREKEQEIVRLRIELEASKIKAEDDEEIVSPLHLGQTLEQVKQKDRDEMDEALKKEFADRHSALSAFVEHHNLRSVDPTGAGVSEELTKELKAIIIQGCSTFQRAMRSEGLRVVELMARRPEGATRVSCHVERAKWQRILDVIRLTSEQQQGIMDLRKTQLSMLKKVYETRQALNMQAMHLMSGDAQLDAQGNFTTPAERKLKCMASSGYSACAQQSLNLNQVLDQLKQNLRQEQHIIMEMNFCTMNRIFYPIQAGLLLVEVFPGHLDMLALANCLAANIKSEDSLDSGKSNSGTSDTCHGPDSP